MTIDNLSVLVSDGESDFALFVVRCLAQVSNLKLHILSNDPWAALRFSRHRHTYHFRPRKDYDNPYLETISQVVTQTGANVFLPTDEPAIQFASTHLQSLTQMAAVPPIPDPETFEKVTDKWLLAKLLKENHIPGPATILYTADECFEQDLRELQFPVLIKPTKGRGGEGIKRFDNPTDLLKHIEDVIKGSSLQYIVQSFVPGYDVDCSLLAKDGKILVYTIQKGLVAGSQSFSASAGIDFVENNQVFDVVSRLVSVTKWNGIAHLDLRYDSQENQVKILELNARYWGSLIGSLIVGVNFPYIACLVALNHSFPTPRYRLGRYIAPGAAIKQKFQRLFGQKNLDFAFDETALPFVLADPMAEAAKLIRQAFAKHR